MKEVTQNLCRCQFFEFLPFSETRQLGDMVFYLAVLLSSVQYTEHRPIKNPVAQLTGF